MKKLFAISVILVLAAGVALAADVGAEIIGMTNFLHSDSSEDAKLNAGGWPGGLRRARAYAGGQNEDGTFGGWFRFETYGPGNPNFHGNAWWKPIDQVKFMLGVNPDGDYSRDGVTRWGFYQVGGDSDVVKEGWAFGDSFYAGWNANGALLTLTPVENLLIFFGVPFSLGVTPDKDNLWDTSGEAKDTFGKFHGQVAYDISGIGSLALTYTSDLNNKASAGKGNGSKLFAYFGLSAIENLGVDIGLGYTLSVKDEATEYVYNAPVAVGLGFKYDAGAFGVKARVQGRFGETSTPNGGSEIKGPTVIDFDILPYYAVSDTVTALLSAGLQISSPDEGDSTTGWHIEPYITVKAGWWAPNFYAGIRIESDGLKYNGAPVEPNRDDVNGETVIKWSVPIGIVFSF